MFSTSFVPTYRARLLLFVLFMALGLPLGAIHPTAGDITPTFPTPAALAQQGRQLLSHSPQQALEQLLHARLSGALPRSWRVALARAALSLNQPQLVRDLVYPENGDPQHEKALIVALRGQAALRLGQLQNARFLLATALNIEPNLYDALLGLGQLAQREANLVASRLVGQRLVQLDATRSEGWLLQARALRLLGDEQAALDVLHHVLKYSHGHAQASEMFVGLLLQQRRWQKATDILATLGTDTPMHGLLKAQLHVLQGRPQHAIEQLDAQLQRHNNHLPTRLLLAGLLYRDDDLARLPQLLQPVIESVPEHLPTHLLMASALIRLDETNRAISLLESAWQSPGYEKLHALLLGSAYIEVGQLQRGLEQLLEGSEALVQFEATEPYALSMELFATTLDPYAALHVDPALTLNVDLAPATPSALLGIVAQLKQGRIGTALELAHRWLDDNPDNLISAYLLAVALQLDDQPQAARHRLEQAISQAPEFVPAHLLLADIALFNADINAAERHYRDTLRIAPGTSAALLGLAEIAALRGDTELELNLVKQAWAPQSKPLEAGLALARAYLLQLDSTQALDVSRELVHLYPYEPSGYQMLAQALIDQGDLPAALVQLRIASEIIPQEAELHYTIAYTLMRLERSEEAEQALWRTLELQGDHLPALADLVELRLQHDDINGAIAVARRLQQRTPSEGLGYQIEGDIHLYAGQREAAITAFERAFERSPNDDLAMQLSNLQLEIKQLDAALSTLEAWLRIDHANSVVGTQYAILLERSGRTDEAMQQYLHLIDADAENLVALNNAAWLMMKRGEKEQALELAEQAWTLQPERAEVIDTLGWILVHGNALERERGISLLQQAAIMAPWLSDIRLHLARAYLLDSRCSDARKVLRDLLADAHEMEDTTEAAQLYAELECKRQG